MLGSSITIRIGNVSREYNERQSRHMSAAAYAAGVFQPVGETSIEDAKEFFKKMRQYVLTLNGMNNVGLVDSETYYEAENTSDLFLYQICDAMKEE